MEEPSCSTSLSKEGKEGTKGEDSTNPSTCSSIIRLFGFSSRRISTSDDHSTIQYGGTSSILRKYDQEYPSCVPLLQEEYEEGPCTTEDPTVQHLVVGNVGGKITSSFFVGDLKIITKEEDSFNGDKEYFGSDPKK